MNCPLSEKEVAEMLKDAGCSQAEIGRVLAQEAAGDRRTVYQLLARHRLHLLDEVHRTEKAIACLDYLVYEMKRRENETEETPW